MLSWRKVKTGLFIAALLHSCGGAAGQTEHPSDRRRRHGLLGPRLLRQRNQDAQPRRAGQARDSGDQLLCLPDVFTHAGGMEGDANADSEKVAQAQPLKDGWKNSGCPVDEEAHA
jgi:hypothetical protein